MFVFAVLARLVVHSPDVVDKLRCRSVEVCNARTTRLLLHQTLSVCFKLLVFGPQGNLQSDTVLASRGPKFELTDLLRDQLELYKRIILRTKSLDDARPNALIAFPTPKYSILLRDLFEIASVPPIVVRCDRAGEFLGRQVLLTSAAVRRLSIKPSRSFTSEGSIPEALMSRSGTLSSSFLRGESWTSSRHSSLSHAVYQVV